MRKSLPTVAFWNVVLLLSGCGAEDSERIVEETAAFERACAAVPGCAEPRFEAPGPTEAVWRVLVTREAAGALRIGPVDSVDVPAGEGVPVGPLGGTHRLVGLDRAGEIVDGQLLRFSEVLRLEFADGRVPEEIDLSGREVDSVGYVRALPSIERLAVQDGTGEVVASAPAPQRQVGRRTPPDLLVAGLGPAQVAPSLVAPAFAASGDGSGTLGQRGDLPPYCSHVLLLEGEADRDLAGALRLLLEEGLGLDPDTPLVRPEPTQRAVLYGALGRMTPLLCQSIGRIGLLAIPADSSRGIVDSFEHGDKIFLNATLFSEQRLASDEARRQFLQHVVTHEAGHSAQSLLSSVASEASFGGEWGRGLRMLATRTIDRVRLRKGLATEWNRVHDSFRAVGWASDFQGEDVADAGWSSAQVARAGFMSGYGATSWGEDASEYVGWTYTTGAFPAVDFSSWEAADLGCREMRGHREESVPAHLAALYTKLLFLQDLGLVAEEDVRACTGPNLRVPAGAPGFHFWEEGQERRRFTSNLQAGIGTQPDGDRVFEMTAEGEASFSDETYLASLRLRLDLESPGLPLDQVAWPRGVYVLGLFGDNNVELRLEGARAGNFDAKDGYVLVAEASNDRIAGSIVLQQAMRLSAPLPVPQVWDPPLVIRFFNEN